MNWKHFLKPDRKKIVLFEIILIIYIIPYISNFLLHTNPVSIFLPSFHYFHVAGQEESIFSCETLNPFGFSLTSVITGYDIVIDYPCPIQYYLTDSLIYIIASYLLSCLLAWVYDKLRKKKE